MSKYIVVIILLISSLSIRHAVYLSGQNWINTKTHTVTIFLLPIITYVITSVISSNIALSLGLVGALSIIRFRNPVKSPFELVIYFLMITIGIAASVNYKWVIFLTLSTLFILFFTYVINYLSIYFRKKPFFLSSFTEGNSLHTLEIQSNKKISILEESDYLVSYIFDRNNFIYRLASSNKKNMTHFIEVLESRKEITHIIFNNA